MTKATDRQVGGDHYKSLPIQPGVFIRKNGIGWYEGNAIKYICRYKQKGGREDLLKVKHYIDLILEELDKDGPTNNNGPEPTDDSSTTSTGCVCEQKR